MNDRFVFMTSYNEMRNDFTFLREGIIKKFGQTCSVKSCFQQTEKHFQQWLESIWKPKSLYHFGPNCKKLNASTNVNLYHFTNIR